MTTYKITGNTYPHRTTLRALGAEWDKSEKVWTIVIRERGMRRNDSALYELRRKCGLRADVV